MRISNLPLLISSLFFIGISPLAYSVEPAEKGDQGKITKTEQGIRNYEKCIEDEKGKSNSKRSKKEACKGLLDKLLADAPSQIRDKLEKDINSESDRFLDEST